MWLVQVAQLESGRTVTQAQATWHQSEALKWYVVSLMCVYQTEASPNKKYFYYMKHMLIFSILFYSSQFIFF